MKGIIIGIVILVVLGLLSLFVFSFLSIGSKCSRAEEATYREYLLSKQRNEDSENKNRKEDQ